MLVIIIIILFIIFIKYKKYFLEAEYVKSDIDNNYYIVRNLKDKQSACNLLSNVRKNCDKLVTYLKNNIQKYKKYKKDIIRLYKNYNPENFSESSSDNKYTSYSVNKGEQIVVCMRSKKNNKLHKLNLIMYVIIHELAHLMSKSIGHTDEFYRNNDFLLKISKKLKIFKSEKGYSNIEYCGLSIQPPK